MKWLGLEWNFTGRTVVESQWIWPFLDLKQQLEVPPPRLGRRGRRWPRGRPHRSPGSVGCPTSHSVWTSPESSSQAGFCHRIFPRSSVQDPAVVGVLGD